MGAYLIVDCIIMGSCDVRVVLMMLLHAVSSAHPKVGPMACGTGSDVLNPDG